MMAAAPRGAGAVGFLAALPPVERAAVVYLRMWCAGGDEACGLADDFRLALGPEEGTRMSALFDRLMRLTLTRTRRSLMRHALGCRCLGGDEAAFAQQVALAAAGDREDALMLALTYLPGQSAEEAVHLSEALGLAFDSMLGGTACGGTQVRQPRWRRSV